MATTDKLKLYLPLGDDFADVQVSVNDQMKIIDNSFKVEIVPNEAGLPAVPYKGQLAYREDIHELYYWDNISASWIYILSRKNAWGRRAQAHTNVAGENVSAGQEKGPYLTCTYNQVVGRSYKVSWNMSLDSPGNGDFGDNRLRIRSKVGPSVEVTDNLLYWIWLDYLAGGASQRVSGSGFFSYTAESTGQITLGVFLARAGVAATAFFAENCDNNIIVEDIGWNG